MSNSDDNTLHFEKEFGEFSQIGTLIIKGTVDRAVGNITGEIGVKALGVYKSIKPFTGNLHDGIHGNFATGVGFGDSSFSIGLKDGAVKAQANLWQKGAEITLFKVEELEAPWHGTLKLERKESSTAVFVSLLDSGNTYIVQLPNKPPWESFSGETSVAGTSMKKPIQRGPHPEELDYKVRFHDTNFEISLSNGSVMRGATPTDQDPLSYHSWITSQKDESFIQTGKCEYYLLEVE